MTNKAAFDKTVQTAVNPLPTRVGSIFPSRHIRRCDPQRHLPSSLHRSIEAMSSSDNWIVVQDQILSIQDNFHSKNHNDESYQYPVDHREF